MEDPEDAEETVSPADDETLTLKGLSLEDKPEESQEPADAAVAESIEVANTDESTSVPEPAPEPSETVPKTYPEVSATSETSEAPEIASEAASATDPETAPEAAPATAPATASETDPETTAKTTAETVDEPAEIIESVEAPEPIQSDYNDPETRVLKKTLKLWAKYPDPLTRLLSVENTSPPVDGFVSSHAAEAEDEEEEIERRLIATVVRVPKNPKVLKGGYLLVPSNDATRWIKRFVELRRPYLHIHSVTDGDEVGIVSLRNARVDSEPGILGLLESRHPDYRYEEDSIGGSSVFGGLDRDDISEASFSHGQSNGNGNGTFSPRSSLGAPTSSPQRKAGLQRLSDRLQAGVFAIYGTDNTWLFAARGERDKMEWITRIDQSFLQQAPSQNGSSNGNGNGAIPFSVSSALSSIGNSRSASPSLAGMVGAVGAMGTFIGSKIDERRGA